MQDKRLQRAIIEALTEYDRLTAPDLRAAVGDPEMGVFISCVTRMRNNGILVHERHTSKHDGDVWRLK